MQEAGGGQDQVVRLRLTPVNDRTFGAATFRVAAPGSRYNCPMRVKAGDTARTKVGGEWQVVKVQKRSADGKLWIVRTGAGNQIYRTAAQLRKA